MATNNKLKAYVRFDGTGRVIPGSLILQRSKPKVGNWTEINANECCGYIPTPSTTTTTTAAPTTTTTTSVAPTTTTTTTVASLYLISGVYSSSSTNICDIPVNNFSPIPNTYCTTPTLQEGSLLYSGNNINNPVMSGIYVSSVQGEAFQVSYSTPGLLGAQVCVN